MDFSNSDYSEPVMRYGVQAALTDTGFTANIGGQSFTASWAAQSGMQEIVYGAPMPSQTTQPVYTAQARDEWWKWAAGAGLVSMAAYIIYQKVTAKKHGDE